jgi:hypothetical protein
MMQIAKWFSREKPAPPLPPVETPEQRLLKLEIRYRLAEADFVAASQEVARYRAIHKPKNPLSVHNGKMYVQVNALFTQDKHFSALDSARVTALKKRNELLSERALLLHEMRKL